MEKNQSTQISVFSVPELLELIISCLISSPQTIFNIASVSKWHNSLVCSEKLWRPYGIIAKDNLKSEWFRIKLFLAEKEEAMLEKRLEEIKRIKWNAMKTKREFEPEEDKPFKFIPKGPKDLEKAVRKILKEKESNKILYWLKILTKSLNVSLSFVPNKNKVAYLVDTEFIPKLMELLRHKKEDVRVLAFAVLAHVASSVNYSHVTHSDDFVEMLVKRLGQEKDKFTNEKLVLPFALAYVAKNQEGAMLLLKHEAVPKLVVPEIFFGDKNMLIQNCLLLIVKHTAAQKPDYFVPYFDDLLKLMSIELEHATSEDYHTLQIMSAYMGVIRSSDHVDKIIKKGVVPMLIKCCQQQNLTEIRSAIGLTADMIANGTKQHVDHFIESGLLEVTEFQLKQGYTQLNVHNVDPVLQRAAKVVYEVMRHYQRTQEIKLFKLIITRLLELANQNANVPLFYETAAKVLLFTCQASNATERAEYVQHGIFNNIVALLDLNSSHILTAAITSLNLFLENSPDLVMQARDYQGIVDKLKRILGQHHDDSELQTAVNKCLTYFQPK